jgi:Endodeoxyribonuclease RusA
MSDDPITVVVSGEPVAKGRPRMTKRGFAYTPAATRKYEAHARLSAQLAMDGHPPIEVPVRIEVLAQLQVPASWSKRKRVAAPPIRQALASGRSTVYERLARGEYEAIKDGKRTLITIESIKRRRANLPRAEFKPLPPRAEFKSLPPGARRPRRTA